MIRPDIAMRRPGRVHHTVEQQQAGALLVVPGAEDYRAAALARARVGRLNRHRAAIPLLARRNVERVQPMNVATGFLGHGDRVYSAGLRIDHRRAGNADFRHDLSAAGVLVGHSSNAGRGVQKADVPQQHPGIGIESVDAIVLGGHVYRVVDALAGDVHVGHDQRLGVDVAVHRVREQPAELRSVHARRV